MVRVGSDGHGIPSGGGGGGAGSVDVGRTVDHSTSFPSAGLFSPGVLGKLEQAIYPRWNFGVV